LADNKIDKKQEYGKSTLDLHRDVLSTIDKMAKKDDATCVLVRAVEKELGRDPRTVRLHLKLLEESGYGRFISNGKLFCLKETRQK
jgi:predicted transcriptional regulator